MMTCNKKVESKLSYFSVVHTFHLVMSWRFITIRGMFSLSMIINFSVPEEGLLSLSLVLESAMMNELGLN